jgi:hypothetical protein
MSIKRLIARRTFVHNNRKYKEGTEVDLKGNELNAHIKRGLVVEKTFVDPLGAEPVVQERPRARKVQTTNQSQKLQEQASTKTEDDKKAS